LNEKILKRPVLPPKLDTAAINRSLEQMRTAFEKGDYSKAINFADDVFKLDKQNAEAKETVKRALDKLIQTADPK
jgi:hypothetical protein